MSQSLVSKLYHGDTKIDFIGRRRLWFLISGVMVGISLISMLTLKLNFGIEFEGGLQIKVPVTEDGPLGDAEDLDVISAVRDDIGVAAQIQVEGEGSDRGVIVQIKEVADEEATEIESRVEETVGGEVTDRQQIGSKWGGEITRKALRALLIFMLVVVLFISWRFEWKMAAASMVALIHDLTITAGVYSLVGFEVTPATVIAILTILGYSLYDTVVVFDKVEENTAILATTGRMTYGDATNLALNQVFMRSLNTSLATILPVGALLIIGTGLLGAETLKDLALALLVGLVISSYSSVFVAVPALSVWKEREPRYRNVREKALRDARRAATAPGPGGPTEASEGAAPTTSAAAGKRPTASTTTRTASKARAGSKKVKRRKRR